MVPWNSLRFAAIRESDRREEVKGGSHLDTLNNPVWGAKSPRMMEDVAGESWRGFRDFPVESFFITVIVIVHEVWVGGIQ